MSAPTDDNGNENQPPAENTIPTINADVLTASIAAATKAAIESSLAPLKPHGTHPTLRTLQFDDHKRQELATKTGHFTNYSTYFKIANNSAHTVDGLRALNATGSQIPEALITSIEEGTSLAPLPKLLHVRFSGLQTRALNLFSTPHRGFVDIDSGQWPVTAQYPNGVNALARRAFSIALLVDSFTAAAPMGSMLWPEGPFR
jgi:hypothetical protein